MNWDGRARLPITTEEWKSAYLEQRVRVIALEADKDVLERRVAELESEIMHLQVCKGEFE